jgi:serine/threonine protein kinase/Tol biopolymer transport system component
LLAAAAILREKALVLSPGTRLGAYEIVAPIGAGGMGEVYRATDTNLKRAVAIKVLPDALAADDERLARFRREAEVLASLNHPNIAAIYGLERSNERIALVMELVEGPTLEERIRGDAIPLEEALVIATQITEALEAAHERGIVHRDLKPANVKVRTDGAVKVLDFGIAKAMEPLAGSAPSVSLSPTITTPAMTRAGMILGTAAYMAPEQARGTTVDRRADIWAFGCVLYEMLTKRRAFDGASAVEVISDVLKTDPEWAALPVGTPAAVRSLLRRCLQRDPNRRLRDAADARFQIEEALSDSVADRAPGRATPFTATPRRTWWVAAVTIASAAAVAASLWFSRRSAPEPEEVRLEIGALPTTEPTSIAVSPDGRMVVFVATAGRQSRLWMRPLNEESAKPLEGTEDAKLPFWSPDSRSVGFAADAQLKRVDIESGAVRVLASGGALGGAWNRDGTILFDRNPGPGLFRVSAEGGEVREVMRGTPEANDQWSPQFLPDHRHYLFYATGTAPGVYGGDLQTSEPPRRIVDAQAAAYASSGHLLFVRKGTLFAQAFDPVRLVLAGSPIVIAEHVVEGGGAGATAALSASASGPIAYRTGPSTARNHFVWFDRSGTAQEAIPGSAGFDAFHSSLSEDESRLALSRIDGSTDIWVLDVKRGVSSRLTFDPAFDLTPEWSPDGRRIAFTSNRKGTTNYALYMKSADGAGKDEFLVGEGLGTTSPNDWSPDGRFILYVIGAGRSRDILALPLEGDGKPGTPIPIVATSFNETNGQFSPDGRWIAFQSDESGQPEIYVQPFLRPGQKVRISTAGGVQARWRRDGKELFYLAPDQRLMAVPIQLDAKLPNAVDVGTPVALFTTSLAGAPQNGSGRHYIVSRDGQRFLMDTLGEVTIPITVVLNWKPKP